MSNPFEVFDSADALVLNQARMYHLESLNLTIKGKSVLDVGCGVGYFSNWWVERKAHVTALDARIENIRETRQRCPQATAWCMDIERHSLPCPPAPFDIVFCYGLLYHLSKPAVALENLRKACSGILLLETIVLDSWDAELMMVPENCEVRNQGMDRMSCRPSWTWLCQALRSVGFTNLYAPVDIIPQHPDFRWEVMNSKTWQHGDINFRRIIVASVAPLEQMPGLVAL